MSTSCIKPSNRATLTLSTLGVMHTKPSVIKGRTGDVYTVPHVAEVFARELHQCLPELGALVLPVLLHGDRLLR